MSQYDFGAIVGNRTSGTQLLLHIGQKRDAVDSSHSGNARPTYARAHMMWLDVGVESAWTLKLFDGTDDITIGTFNPTTNIFKPSTAGLTIGDIAGLVNALAGKADDAEIAAINQALAGRQAAGTTVAKTGDTMTGTLEVSNTAPEIALNDTDAGARVQMHYNGGIWGIHRTGFGWKFQVHDNGHLWSPAYGFIHDWVWGQIAGRAVSDIRLGAQVFQGGNFNQANIAPAGAVQVGTRLDGANEDVPSIYYRRPQKFIDGNWYDIGSV